MVVALAVQLLNHVQFFSIPWTAALEAPLSFTISWSLLKLMSIELVMPSNHLIFCLPLLLLLSILLASEKRGDSLAFWTFFWHFHCQGRVCSLVRKLRSHKPPRAPPTNKKKKRYILYAWGGMEPPVSEQGQKGQRPYPLIYWDHQSDGPITIFLALRVELEGKSSL